MSASFEPCGDVRSEAWPEKPKSYAVQYFIFSYVGIGSSRVGMAEKFFQGSFGTVLRDSCWALDKIDLRRTNFSLVVFISCSLRTVM